MNVSLPLVVANLGLLCVLLATKLVSKSAAVFPLARKYAPAHAWPVALLMSTGLTFGTIASQAGLSMGVITKAQFSVLICAIALSAVVPTAVAQRMLVRHPVVEAEADELSIEGDAPVAVAAGDDEVPTRRLRRQPPDRPFAKENPELGQPNNPVPTSTLDPDADPTQVRP
jgi:hypothetical protein